MAKQTEAYKLALAKLKGQQRLEAKRIKASAQTRTANISRLRTLRPAPLLTTEQDMLQEFFGSRNQTWGTGQNLPTLKGNLNPNILGYDEDETAQSFGIGRIKGGTGSFFGI